MKIHERNLRNWLKFIKLIFLSTIFFSENIINSNCFYAIISKCSCKIVSRFYNFIMRMNVCFQGLNDRLLNDNCEA